MKTAAANVTNRGGRPCHGAIVSRERHITAGVGAQNATANIPSGETTLSCAEGDVGKVYESDIPFGVNKTDLSSLKQPSTEIMINLGNRSWPSKQALSLMMG